MAPVRTRLRLAARLPFAGDPRISLRPSDLAKEIKTYRMDEQFAESFESLRSNLLAESDRGCVLIAAAYLDDTLESVLRRYFSQDADCISKAIDPMFQGLAS